MMTKEFMTDTDVEIEIARLKKTDAVKLARREQRLIGMNKITVADVAKALGQDPQVCREFIKAGLYPFAVAHRREGRKQWCYTIFPAKFNEYIGNGGKPDVSKLV